MALTKVPSNLDATIATTQSQADNSTNIATTAYVDLAISNLSDSAPAALNTLNEIAAALGDDANYASTTTAAIAGKLPLAGGTMTGNLTVNAIVDADNYTINGGQGTDGQVLTSTGSGVAWEDAPASGPTFKTFGTDSIMIGDTTTGTIDAANYNTGLGVKVFNNLTTGDKNTAVGYYTMGGRSSGSMTGGDNTAIGYEAMPRVTSGQHNTSVGAFSGEYLSTGQGNTYIGYYAGYQNFTGSFNSVMGRAAFLLGDGSHNVAIGRRTLQNNGTKEYNTALGNYALSMVTTGGYNTGLGYEAGRQITTGSKNVIIGSYDGNENGLDIRTSSNNIVLSDGDANIRMYIDNTGNVGIGTSSPGTTLDVIGTLRSNVSGGTPIVYLSNGTTQHSIQNTSGALTFFNDGTERMRITGDGTMGFGMSPLGTNNGSAFFDGNVSSKDGFMTTGTDLQLIAPSATNTIFVRDNGNESMRINASGNVGIGTTSPNQRLTVNLPERSDTETNSLGAAVVAGPISGPPSHDFTNSNCIFRVHGSNATNNLQFGVGNGTYGYNPWIQASYDNTSPGNTDHNAKHLLIQPIGGSVAIGKETYASAKLEVVGSIYSNNEGGSSYGSSYGTGAALRVINLSVNQSATHYIEIGGNLPGYNAGQYNCVKTDLTDMHFAAGGVYTGYIGANTGFNDISDEREKENIVTISNATAKLKQLRGVYHTWKDTENRGTDTHIGLIAQEVEAVVPEVVSTSNPTSLNTPESDTDGLKGVAYAKLVPLLIETIKELEARITTLENA
jgi:trimeric autotransporter adhesin